jgi:hypothetical protein
VQEFYGLKQVDAATRTKLRHDLLEPDLTTAVHDFQQDLTAADGSAVDKMARARLSSLANRLTSSSAGPTPRDGKPAPPGPDPVRGPEVA